MGGEKVSAQNAICVVNTQQITYKCVGSCGKNGCGCTSETTATVPRGGYGAGQYYTSQVSQCCGNPVSYIGNPYGSCEIQGGAVKKETTSASEKRIVFVRQCDGCFEQFEVGS